jgi:hypothetical protein
MKSRQVLWGTNAQEDRVLIAMQLRADDNKVDIFLFPEAIASPEFTQLMLTEWRNDVDVAFPEGGQHIEKELSVTENLLPDDIKVERMDLVNRAQSEWHFIVLSTKLHAAYKSELAELEDRVTRMADYSGDAWDALKNFWNKVQEQMKERNLFHEHGNELRDATNGLFTHLKNMRNSVMHEFEDNSKSWYEQINNALDDIEHKIEKGIKGFPDAFDLLKQTQSKFRDQKMTREHANNLWNRIDGLFKTVKEKKFGASAINDSSATERLTRRYEGLVGAVDKMQDSIDRDTQDLEYQRKRVEQSEGQLEAQLRQAKITMIRDRVKSKQEKLDEMLATKADVEVKINNLKERDAREAKRAAEPKQAPKAVAVKQEAKAVVEIIAPIVTVSVPENGKSDMSDIAANANAGVEAAEAVMA